VEHRARDAASRIVDPHVESAERINGHIPEALDVAALRDIRLDGDRAGRTAVHRLARYPLQLRPASRCEDERVTVNREAHRDTGTDTGARASDDDRLVCHLYPPLPWCTRLVLCS